jgi:hypothetical protein
MKRVWFSLGCIAVIACLAAGCGVESGTNPIPTVPVELTVSFDFTAPTTTIPGDDVQRGPDPDLGGAPDSVTVVSGLLMVRSVRLNTEAVTEVDTVITAADEGSDVNDASVRFHGPYVVELDGNTLNLGETSVPASDYKQVTFVLQKARSSDNLSGHDELLGSSLRVTGKVWRNGIGHSFVYETGYTSEFAVNGNFDLSESTDGRLNLSFHVGHWFHNGGHWLDPETPTNNLQILNNVRGNISGALEVLN